MLQPVRCIKFGEIVVDENRTLLLLCSNCHTDYNSLQEFRQHFDHCGQCERQDLFKENVSLVFPSLGATDTKQLLLSRCVKGSKEFLIYKYNGLRRMEPLMLDSCKNDDDFMDLIKIEEELLDPRWYSDLTNAPDMVYVEPHQQQLQLQQHLQLQQIPQQTSASYNELVEAVTPYVQFKENLKNTNERNIATTTSLTTTTSKKKHKILNKAANGTLSVKTLAGASDAKVKSYTNGKRRPSFVATNGGTSSIILPAAAALPAASSPPSTSPPPQALPALQKLPLQQKQRIVKRNAAANKNTKPNTPPVIEAKITTASFAVAPCNNNNKQNLPVPLNSEVAAAVVSLPVMPPPNIMLPAKYMQTQKILSKLQNMGLQVKRKQPPEEPPKPMQDADDDPAKQQTLALLKKLQSKGMNVKIIPNAKAATAIHYSSDAPPPKKMAAEELMTLNANLVQSTQLNRNLIIKKLN